jgi:hypothetical protein
MTSPSTALLLLSPWNELFSSVRICKLKRVKLLVVVRIAYIFWNFAICTFNLMQPTTSIWRKKKDCWFIVYSFAVARPSLRHHEKSRHLVNLKCRGRGGGGFGDLHTHPKCNYREKCSSIAAAGSLGSALFGFLHEDDRCFSSVRIDLKKKKERRISSMEDQTRNSW